MNHTPNLTGVALELASDGARIPVSSLEQTITRDESGRIATIAVEWLRVTYLKTITRDEDGNITNSGRFVRQAS